MMSPDELRAALARFDRDGYLVVENAIEPDLVGAIREGLDRAERDHALGLGQTDFEGRNTVRIYNLLAYGEVFWQVPIHPVALQVAEAILDPELQLSSLSAITLCPGQGAQTLHADDQLIPVPKPHQPFTLNCVWAISDFTEANGATMLVPGSHKAGDRPDYDMAVDTITGEMPAGSLLFWHGSLWHAGGHNRTEQRRYALSNYYCAGFIRQQENQYLGLDRADVRRMPRRLQELCGWSVYKGLYGHVDNVDPITQLGHPDGAKLIWQRTLEEMYETAARR